MACERPPRERVGTEAVTALVVHDFGGPPSAGGSLWAPHMLPDAMFNASMGSPLSYNRITEFHGVS